MENPIEESNLKDDIYQKHKLLLNVFCQFVSDKMKVLLVESPDNSFPKTVKAFFERFDNQRYCELFHKIFNEQYIRIICQFLEFISRARLNLNRALQPTTIYSMYRYQSKNHFKRPFTQLDIERYETNGQLAAKFVAAGHAETFFEPHEYHKSKSTQKLRGKINSQEKAYNISISKTLRAEVMTIYLPKLLKYFCECFLDTNYKHISFVEFFHMNNFTVSQQVPQQLNEVDDFAFVEQIMTSFQVLIGASSLRDMYQSGIAHKRRNNPNHVSDVKYKLKKKPINQVQQVNELEPQSIDIVDMFDSSDLDQYFAEEHFVGLNVDTGATSSMNSDYDSDASSDFDNVLPCNQPLNLTNLCICESSNGIRNGLGQHENGSGLNAILQILFHFNLLREEIYLNMKSDDSIFVVFGLKLIFRLLQTQTLPHDELEPEPEEILDTEGKKKKLTLVELRALAELEKRKEHPLYGTNFVVLEDYMIYLSHFFPIVVRGQETDPGEFLMYLLTHIKSPLFLGTKIENSEEKIQDPFLLHVVPDSAATSMLDILTLSCVFNGTAPDLVQLPGSKLPEILTVFVQRDQNHFSMAYPLEFHVSDDFIPANSKVTFILSAVVVRSNYLDENNVYSYKAFSAERRVEVNSPHSVKWYEYNEEKVSEVSSKYVLSFTGDLRSEKGVDLNFLVTHLFYVRRDTSSKMMKFVDVPVSVDIHFNVHTRFVKQSKSLNGNKRKR